MRNICLYPHPSSRNHGCEAIAICTDEIIKKSLPESSISLAIKYEWSDERAGTKLVEQFVDNSILCTLPALKRFSVEWFEYQLLKKVIHKDKSVDILANHFYRHNRALVENNDIFFSIGGDNYCYGRPTGLYAIHKAISDREKKSILYGCSIEPSVIDEEMLTDLKKYSLIVCRESITFNALIQKGLNNAVIFPDPAFTLKKSDKTKVELPENTIGINVSPMILEYSSNANLVYAAFLHLMEYILKNTNYNIALIPHVTAETTDDRKPLKKLYKDLNENKRIIFIDDMDCTELKNVISQCRFFIGARTHATIAAYSTCVPTLVCGYSVKAKGIATDLFGTYENYVIPVQSLDEKKQLLDAFLWMEKHEEDIKEHLQNTMPKYIEKAFEIGKVIADEF